MSGHYNPESIAERPHQAASFDTRAGQVPVAWRRNLQDAGIDHHPAQLVWVSGSAIGDDDVVRVFTVNRNISHRQPPLPCSWAVFQRPLVFGSYHHDGGVDQPILLRSVEWSHRHDDTVLITGYTVIQQPLGGSDPGLVIPVATRAGTEGLVSFDEAAAMGVGTLITGEPVPAPMATASASVPRRAQRMLAQVVHRVWQQWESRSGDLAVGQVFLSEDEPAQSGGHRPRRLPRGVRVVVVSRRGERISDLGEVASLEHARSTPDHRWRVRGHYRNQPCGPGGKDRRKIWVHEHVSGPPGKPVKNADTVLALR